MPCHGWDQAATLRCSAPSHADSGIIIRRTGLMAAAEMAATEDASAAGAAVPEAPAPRLRRCLGGRP